MHGLLNLVLIVWVIHPQSNFQEEFEYFLEEQTDMTIEPKTGNYFPLIRNSKNNLILECPLPRTG